MSHANEHTRTSFEDSVKSILDEIKTTQEKLAFLQGDRREQRAYESYLMSCANALDVLRGQYELGREAGIAEGRAEVKKQ